MRSGVCVAFWLICSFGAIGGGVLGLGVVYYLANTSWIASPCMQPSSSSNFTPVIVESTKKNDSSSCPPTQYVALVPVVVLVDGVFTPQDTPPYYSAYLSDPSTNFSLVSRQLLQWTSQNNNNNTVFTCFRQRYYALSSLLFFPATCASPDDTCPSLTCSEPNPLPLVITSEALENYFFIGVSCMAAGGAAVGVAAIAFVILASLTTPQPQQDDDEGQILT